MHGLWTSYLLVTQTMPQSQTNKTIALERQWSDSNFYLLLSQWYSLSFLQTEALALLVYYSAFLSGRQFVTLNFVFFILPSPFNFSSHSLIIYFYPSNKVEWLLKAYKFVTSFYQIAFCLLCIVVAYIRYIYLFLILFTSSSNEWKTSR